MTKPKNEHWTSECKRIREERDKLLLQIMELNKQPKLVQVEDKYANLLREIYDMTSHYYCDIFQIRFKIKKSGVIDE